MLSERCEKDKETRLSAVRTVSHARVASVGRLGHRAILTGTLWYGDARKVWTDGVGTDGLPARIDVSDVAGKVESNKLMKTSKGDARMKCCFTF